jgi:hypothetical protein
VDSSLVRRRRRKDHHRRGLGLKECSREVLYQQFLWVAHRELGVKESVEVKVRRMIGGCTCTYACCFRAVAIFTTPFAEPGEP